MADAAYRLGFYSLGFSVHSPMKFDIYYALKPERAGEYINCIHALKEKYSGKMEVYCGIELDANYAYVNKADFDYVIGSVHHLHCGEKLYGVDETPGEIAACVENEFGGNWLSAAEQYYASLAEHITKSKPDVAGHFDLITKFNEGNRFFDENSDEYKKIALKYIKKICRENPNVIFEVNTGAMFRCGNSKPYPARFLLEYLYEQNMRITVTSDAHCPEALNFAFDKAEAFIREVGFKEVYMLKNGKFEAVSL